MRGGNEWTARPRTREPPSDRYQSSCKWVQMISWIRHFLEALPNFGWVVNFAPSIILHIMRWISNGDFPLPYLLINPLCIPKKIEMKRSEIERRDSFRVRWKKRKRIWDRARFPGFELSNNFPFGKLFVGAIHLWYLTWKKRTRKMVRLVPWTRNGHQNKENKSNIPSISPSPLVRASQLASQTTTHQFAAIKNILRRSCDRNQVLRKKQCVSRYFSPFAKAAKNFRYGTLFFHHHSKPVLVWLPRALSVGGIYVHSILPYRSNYNILICLPRCAWSPMWKGMSFDASIHFFAAFLSLSASSLHTLLDCGIRKAILPQTISYAATELIFAPWWVTLTVDITPS